MIFYVFREVLFTVTQLHRAAALERGGRGLAQGQVRGGKDGQPLLFVLD